LLRIPDISASLIGVNHLDSATLFTVRPHRTGASEARGAGDAKLRDLRTVGAVMTKSDSVPGLKEGRHLRRCLGRKQVIGLQILLSLASTKRAGERVEIEGGI